MKKIYLFSILLMGVVTSSIGQNTCPPGLSTVAWKYKYPGSTDPHCMVIFNSNINESGYQIALIDFDGNPIPQFDGSDAWVDVNPSTGSASVIYDCYDPTFVEVEYVALKRVVSGTTLVNCQLPAADPAVTPVKITAFTGRLQTDNAVVLDWTSSIEWDSYKYEVERSEDGLHFSKVGDLKAAGNSNYTVKYTFNDQLPYAGAFFYRLKQIDFNGTFENSKVVYVNSKKGAGIISKVFPNPTRGEIQIIGATSVDLTPKNLNIFSIAGQRVKYRVVGANAISLDATAPDGVYILKIQTQEGVLKQFKIVKNQAAGNY